MRINQVSIDGYKSLNDFNVSFSTEKVVIIGQNASGKSNFLEAIVIIFRNLDLNADPEFSFTIHYTINGKDILIKGFPQGSQRNRYAFWEISKNEAVLFDDKEVQIHDIFKSDSDKGNLTYAAFKKNKNDYLPKHVFVYYSGLGNSNRLEEILQKLDYSFAKTLLDAEGYTKPEDRRFFYVRLHHSHFVLLSFYALTLDNDIEAFLKENLKIENLETILFILKQPFWKTTKDGNQ